MNERIQRLRKELTEQKPYVDGERCKIFTESMKTTDGLPIIIRRAKSFYEVLDKMTVWVKPGELIVGNMAKNAKSSPVFPEYSAQWILEELDGKPYRWEDRPGDKFYILPEDEKIVRECAEYWNGKTLYDYVRKNLPKEVNDAWDAGVTDETWVCAAGLGNEIVDYKMVVEKGLEDVLTRIQEKKDSIDILDPDALKQLHFLEAAKLGNEAVLNYSNRLADKCEEEAGKTEWSWLRFVDMYRFIQREHSKKLYSQFSWFSLPYIWNLMDMQFHLVDLISMYILFIRKILKREELQKKKH